LELQQSEVGAKLGVTTLRIALISNVEGVVLRCCSESLQQRRDKGGDKSRVSRLKFWVILKVQKLMMRSRLFPLQEGLHRVDNVGVCCTALSRIVPEHANVDADGQWFPLLLMDAKHVIERLDGVLVGLKAVGGIEVELEARLITLIGAD